MTLTPLDFDALNEKEKSEAVFEYGTFIDNREEDGSKVQLYRLDNFYIEVFYDGKANQIFRYRAFSSVSQLSAYLKNS